MMQLSIAPYSAYKLKIDTTAHFMRHFFALVKFGVAVWDGDYPAYDGIHTFAMRIDDIDLSWHCSVVI